MTDKELSYAIARKLGWKDIPPIPGREHLFEGYMLKPDAKSEHDIDKVPDFTGSMDHIRTALRTLTNAQFEVFIEEMVIIHHEETKGRTIRFEQWEFQESKPIHYARALAETWGILPVAGKEVEG